MMSEDLAALESDLEALMAALELAGVMAEQARTQARRLAKLVSREVPKSRAEWSHRAQLNSDGENLGWLDTKDARRVNLADATGAKDRLEGKSRGAKQEEGTQGQQVSEIVEVEGQFFAVTHAAGIGQPEQVEAISAERARTLLERHRPEIKVNADEKGMSFVDSREKSAVQDAPEQASKDSASRRLKPRPEVAMPEPDPRARKWSTTGPAVGQEAAAPTEGRRSAAAAFGATEGHAPKAAEVIAAGQAAAAASVTK